MNKCKQCQAFIEACVEGQLNETDRATLEQHVKTCSDCRDQYAQAQTLAVVLNESFQPALSCEQAANAILGSIVQQPEHPQIARTAFPFEKVAAGLLIAAGLILSFAVGRTSLQWPAKPLTQSPYTIRSIEGTVLVKHAGSKLWQPLTSDSIVYIDDQFLSAPDGQVTFQVNRNSSIELKANSMLVLNITPDQTNLHLIHGTLNADLESPHGPFFVTTPHGRAEALGTEFTVNVD